MNINSNGKSRYKSKTVGSVPAIVVVPSTQKQSVSAPTCTNTSTVSGSGTTVYTTVTATATITIFDQFGNVLDSIYDGQGYVSETWTNVTVRNAELSNGPIDTPTGILTSGVILDEVGFILSQPNLSMSDSDRQAWANFTFMLPGGNYNNVFAYTTYSRVVLPYAQGTQNLTVHGFSVKPAYVRTQQTTATNYPPPPFTVTQT